ncbi:hypothetical protein DOE78_23375 [Bacillus sp. Y1]|nr:hypothetical protein [Bacillus sp. Y1]AYA78103.1 hypothetical protein DOE78_23375 [Bacillus sp. Y1]
MLNSYPLLFLAAMLAGFGLLRVPVSGFLTPLDPLIDGIGVLTVLIFALALIYHGLMFLAGKKKF